MKKYLPAIAFLLVFMSCINFKPVNPAYLNPVSRLVQKGYQMILIRELNKELEIKVNNEPVKEKLEKTIYSYVAV